LGQLYDSLVSQTSDDFLWLVIDDGSSDGTRDLVQSWIVENKIVIKYVYQQNQGMHGGHNTAYANIETELNVCIDSDDFMPPNAIADILELWQKSKHYTLAGIIGLDAYKDGSIVGTKMPENTETATLSGLYASGVKGDKKVVLRTDVVRQFEPYPLFESERFVPLGILYLAIDQRYQFLCLNKVLCVVEYLPDGSSLNIFRQYRRNPMGFRHSRIIEMRYAKNPVYIFTRAMHYVSSSLFAKKYDVLVDSPKKITTLLAIPAGLLLHAYILFKSRK
jgi:glycosyltransferase involved in cell wall biosynthesis